MPLYMWVIYLFLICLNCFIMENLVTINDIIYVRSQEIPFKNAPLKTDTRTGTLFLIKLLPLPKHL